MTVTNFKVLNDLIAKANKAMGRVEESKTLTTKDRKKLKKSTFCGPNKSFPVPDCKHVATAKAYLGRSKVSKATKQKIAACINRKAKSLGCNVTKKAKAYTEYSYKTLDKDAKVLYSSDIFATTKELVDWSLKNPDCYFADCDCLKGE